MRFGIFYEHQLPRPWDPDAEARIVRESLEQVELADRLGFDSVWIVEHHFLEEYSHSSAPEVFLAAASQRTERIRLGHGIVNVMPGVNHPARVAERLATLDLVSGGRVEFGTGESSSASELGGFLVDRERKRAMWHEAVDVITRMFVETPFAGVDGDHVVMPPRNVVPKPLQKPHPPLWVACSRRETIGLAARSGIGALSFSFVEPEDAAKWVDEYYALIESDECVPVGFAVNPSVAVVLPMMLARDEADAIERGIDGAHFFAYSLAHFYGGAEHRPGVSDVWQSFGTGRDEAGLARSLVHANDAPLVVRLMEAGMGSLRGAIGSTAQVRELCERYAAAGVDQMIFILQSGKNRHEDICESLELFAAEVMPAFVEGREEAEALKAARLAPAVDRALARREPPARLATPYVIDEQAEVAHTRTPTELVKALDPRGAPGLALATGRRLARSGVTKVLGRLVDGTGDAELERRFGGTIVQRVMFEGMARSFVPEAAAGFQGVLAYELTRPATGGEPARWTIEVFGDRAVARVGDPSDGGRAALNVTFTLSDFVRVAAGKLDPAEPLLHGRATFKGDLALAARLAEMFGAPSPY